MEEHSSIPKDLVPYARAYESLGDAVTISDPSDKLVFINDDRFAHNIFSETPGHEFNIRKQMPGDRYVITLDRKGEFRVRCAIHPRMRMKITVE